MFIFLLAYINFLACSHINFFFQCKTPGTKAWRWNHLVRSAGIEPTLLAPEAGVLSTGLRALNLEYLFMLTQPCFKNKYSSHISARVQAWQGRVPDAKLCLAYLSYGAGHRLGLSSRCSDRRRRRSHPCSRENSCKHDARQRKAPMPVWFPRCNQP